MCTEEQRMIETPPDDDDSCKEDTLPGGCGSSTGTASSLASSFTGGALPVKQPTALEELSRGHMPTLAIPLLFVAFSLLPVLLIVSSLIHAMWMGSWVSLLFLAVIYELSRVLSIPSYASVVPFARVMRLYLLPFIFIYVMALEFRHSQQVASMVALGLTTLRYWFVQNCAATRSSSSSSSSLKVAPPGKEATSVNNSPNPPHLRVLLASDSFFPKIDGVTTYTTRSTQHLVNMGHTVHIVTSIDAQGDHLKRVDGITRLRGIVPAICPTHSVTIPDFWTLKLFMEYKPDVVQCFENGLLTGFMTIACWLADIPILISHHSRIDLHHEAFQGYDAILKPWTVRCIMSLIYRFFLSSANGHLCVCETLCRIVKNAGCRNVQFWRSGADLDLFHPKNRTTAMRKRLAGDGNDEDLPIVVHVGRLMPDKNSKRLIEVIKEYHRRYPNTANFAIVGDGTDRTEIEDALEGQAVFTGFLTGTNLGQAFASSDIFFSPSVTEAVGLVFLEAMAAGLAICGADAGGVPFLFTDGVEGHRFAPLDLDAEVEALHRTIQLFPSREERIKTTRSRAELYGWDLVMDEQLDMMQDAVAEHRASK